MTSKFYIFCMSGAATKQVLPMDAASLELVHSDQGDEDYFLRCAFQTHVYELIYTTSESDPRWLLQNPIDDESTLIGELVLPKQNSTFIPQFAEIVIGLTGLVSYFCNALIVHFKFGNWNMWFDVDKADSPLVTLRPSKNGRH